MVRWLAARQRASLDADEPTPFLDRFLALVESPATDENGGASSPRPPPPLPRYSSRSCLSSGIREKTLVGAHSSRPHPERSCFPPADSAHLHVAVSSCRRIPATPSRAILGGVGNGASSERYPQNSLILAVFRHNEGKGKAGA
jgi:hypothetical protein